MKHLRRATALLLATVLVICGLPDLSAVNATSAVRQEEGSFPGETPRAALPQTGMRFVQTGFDAETGILTMSLQIKLHDNSSAEADNEYVMEDCLSEGYFAFRVNTSNLVAVTRPRNGEYPQDIAGNNGRVAVVSGSQNPEILNYLASDEAFRLEGSFGDLMSPPTAFDPNHTALFAYRNITESGNVMMDYYFQFSLRDNTHLEKNEEGYVTVMDFDFQCSGGTGAESAPLFRSSIQIPQNEAEAQEICRIFSYENESGETVPMTMGGAGFLQKYFVLDDLGQTSHCYSYCYFADAVVSPWRRLIMRNDAYTEITEKNNYWAKNPSLITGEETAPGAWYDNCESDYVVKGFVASNNNTHSGDESFEGTDPDFNSPTESEVGTYPRYVIPTEKRSQENDESRSWIPDAYLGESNRPVALKYYVGTSVPLSSTSSPEHEDLNKLLDSIRWEFLLDGVVSLEECETEFTGDAPKAIETKTGTVTVRTAEIKDDSLAERYQGAKVWKAYDENGEYLFTSPVGVLMILDPDTEITYYDAFDGVPGEKKAFGKAPQLHVTNQAADPDSCIWKYNTAGMFFLQATYDPEGLNFTAAPMSLRLYKDAPSPERTDLDTSSIEETENSEGQPVLTFFVGNAEQDGSGAETAEDAVYRGIPVASRVYDQYGAVMEGIYSTLTLTPTEETQRVYDSAGKENPFTVEQVTAPDGSGNPNATVPTNDYTIKYKAGTGTNTVQPGTYILKAEYVEKEEYSDKERKLQFEKTVVVNKPADRFNYLSTSFRSTNSFEMTSEETTATGKTIGVQCTVPVRSANVTSTSATGSIHVLELANQWRSLNQYTGEMDSFDILPGLRDREEDGTLSGTDMNLEKIRSAGIGLSFTVAEGSTVPRGIDISGLQGSGSFTYSNAVPDGAELSLEVEAAYGDVTRVVRYNITFVRDNRFLQTISILPKGSETSISIEVPAANEEAVEYTTNVIPYDQYATQWNWGDISVDYAPGGRLNMGGLDYGIWKMECVDSEGNPTEPPKGVTLENEHGSTLRVTSAARNSTMYVRAGFAGINSPITEVTIRQLPSKPTVVNKVNYGTGNAIAVPTAGREARVVIPTMNVYDQYNDLMAAGDYSTSFRAVITPSEARAYVKVNATTGEMTIEPCALACTVEVTAIARANGASQSATAIVEVQREPTRVAVMEITEKELDYPNRALGITSSATQLTAQGETQYGVNQELGENDLVWTLEAVEFPDMNYMLPGEPDEETGEADPLPEGVGEVEYNISTGRYSARNSVTLTSSGTINFLSVTDSKQAPKSVTVSARYQGSVSTSQKITINVEESKIDRIYFPIDVYKDGIQVPETGSTNTLRLEAYPRDQYGIYMDLPLTWSIPEGASIPEGVSVDLTAGTVTVSNTAKQGAFPLTASAGGLTETQYISIVQNEALKVTTVEITGLRGRDSMEIPLPAAKGGTGYDVYTVIPMVRDQFNNPMSGAVRWTVSKTEGGVKAEFTGSSTGVLKVSFTEEALKSGTSTITVRATSDSDTTKWKEADITVTKQASIATYARPEVTDWGEGAETVGGKTYPIVPQRGAPNTQVKLMARTFDQYGQEMPGETANIRLSVLGTGLSMNNTGNSTATLSIGSTVVGRLVQVEAVPAGQDRVLEDSRLQIQLSKGTSYPFRLSAEGEYIFSVPYWVTDPNSNVPAEAGVDQVTLRAEVLDQYDAWMETSADIIYPIWEFTSDHEGVEFAEGAARNGTSAGEDLVLDVTSEAVGAGESSRDVHLKVSTAGKEGQAEFTKTVVLHLTKQPSKASYLYIDDVNEDGVIEDAVKRPYAEEGKTVYQFSPTVYDQYKAKCEDAKISYGLEKAGLEQNGYLVEESGGQKDGPPDQYRIYRVEEDSEGQESKILIAEFDRRTGKLTVYTACRDLTGLVLTATSEELGITKKAQVVISQEEPRLYSVEIGGAEAVYNMRTGEEAEDVNQYIYPVILDQYGQVFTGRTVSTWELYLPGKTAGEVLPYDSELDEEGKERLPGQFLVQLGSTRSDGSNILYIKKDSFFQQKDVVLRCQTRDRSDLTKMVSKDLKIRVQRYGSGARRLIIVSFDAGKYGKPVGQTQYAVEYGRPPENVPGVKSIEGYGFMGWTTDGKTVVDAGKIPLYSSTAYYAVYRNVAQTQFLDGYADGRVSPNGQVTRAEFVKMLISAIGGYDPNENYGVPNFTDVRYGKWYTNYIAFAQKKGLIDGYPGGAFRPDSRITRAEAAKMLAEAMELTDNVYTGAFTDVPENRWYTAHIENLYQAKVISGYGDGTFRPRTNVSRGEAVKMILMITENAPSDFELENIREYAYCPFKDIQREHWAYPYLLRAAGVA